LGEHKLPIELHVRRRGRFNWSKTNQELFHGDGRQHIFVLVIIVASIGLIPILKALVLYGGRVGIEIVEVESPHFNVGLICVICIILNAIAYLLAIFKRNFIRPPNYRSHGFSFLIKQLPIQPVARSQSVYSDGRV
jgi:hypothetical protein